MTNLEKQIISIINRSPIANKIKSIALFGSYAKKLHTKNSDVDILVELSGPVGLALITTEILLQDELGKKIDLLTEEWISKYLIDEIKQTKKIIYER